MKVTVCQYYRGFVSLLGALAGVPFVPPVVHFFIPDSNAIAGYLYPPIGDSQQLTLCATFLFLLITTYVVFQYQQAASKQRVHTALVLWVGIAACVCALIALYGCFVRRIPVPVLGIAVPVSVGFERTDFARQWYPNSNDWEMLHDTGPTEDRIQDLWTLRSILAVRALLWGSYSLMLACFLAVVSLAVYQHSAEEAEKKVGALN
jgi:hypothetical protein